MKSRIRLERHYPRTETLSQAFGLVCGIAFAGNKADLQVRFIPCKGYAANKACIGQGRLESLLPIAIRLPPAADCTSRLNSVRLRLSPRIHAPCRSLQAHQEHRIDINTDVILSLRARGLGVSFCSSWLCHVCSELANSGALRRARKYFVKLFFDCERVPMV